MDNVLQGTKGERTVYVDNLGRVTDTVSRKEPEAGNDVYLTIHSDLQIGIYHLIEQHLASILASNMVNSLVDENNNKDWKISVYDAYFQIINNNIVDCDKFNLQNASENHLCKNEFP